MSEYNGIIELLLFKITLASISVFLIIRADIGVGAGIAFNDHVENGNWADLE